MYMHTHDCLIAPRSSDYPGMQPEYNAVDENLSHIWSVHSAYVITSDIAWGLAEAEQEKKLREELRTSLDSQGRLICHTLNTPFLLKSPPIDRQFERTLSN